ncbi:MAG: Lrp/AsnC family transcriptional regulator [Candidatus Micrarchaeota archaeon]
MDKRDRTIIGALMEDARAPYSSMARRLGISEAAVRKRVRNLEEAGIISKYTIRVDPGALGYGAIAIIGIDTEPDALVRVQEKVRAIKGVRYTSLSSGDHMLLFGVWCRDMKELESLIAKAKSLPGVTKICPAVMLKSVEYCE